MAKAKLSKDAIAFLIRCRDDTSTVYTWKEISDLLKEKFNIEISRQAVAKNYSKYKGNTERNTTLEKQKDFKTFKSVRNLENKTPRKEFVEFSDDEFQKMLKGD